MIKQLVIVAASVIAIPAFAGTQTWNFTSSSTPLSGSDFGNTLSDTQDGIGLTVSGWSDSLGTTNTSDPNSEVVEAGKLMWYGSGTTLGLINRDETDNTPNHSIDSYDDSSNSWGDDYDMVLLEFTEAVNLTGVDIGWAQENYVNSSDRGQGQSDLTILAHTGSNSTISGLSWSQVAAGGNWSTVENIANADNYNYQSVSGSIESKFWLVGVYNPLFGGSLSAGNDGFKLAGVHTRTSEGDPVPSVSEPGTLAILSAGLLALLGRRKKQA